MFSTVPPADWLLRVPNPRGSFIGPGGLILILVPLFILYSWNELKYQQHGEINQATVMQVFTCQHPSRAGGSSITYSVQYEFTDSFGLDRQESDRVVPDATGRLPGIGEAISVQCIPGEYGSSRLASHANPKCVVLAAFLVVLGCGYGVFLLMLPQETESLGSASFELEKQHFQTRPRQPEAPKSWEAPVDADEF